MAGAGLRRAPEGLHEQLAEELTHLADRLAQGHPPRFHVPAEFHAQTPAIERRAGGGGRLGELERADELRPPRLPPFELLEEPAEAAAFRDGGAQVRDRLVYCPALALEAGHRGGVVLRRAPPFHRAI